MNNLNTDNQIIIEMIITVDAKEDVASNIRSFNSLLQAHPHIAIHKNHLKWKGIQFDYKLQHGNIDLDNNFFDIELKVGKNNDENLLEEFTSLIREIKKIVGRFTTTPPQMIWDDISKHYASQAYPLIHNIENILRKLITKFMLINIGVSWIKQTLPDDFKASRSGEKSTSSRMTNHILYDTDFIQLSDFLFATYKDIDVADLIKILEKINPQEFSPDTLDSIKKFVPRSNWDKHLKNHVDCEGSFLKKRWSDLYDLRCQIAHNNTFTLDDFNKVKSIIDDIYPPLTDAISKLDKVKITEEEKQEIVDELDKQELVKEIDKQEGISHDKDLLKRFIAQSNKLASDLRSLSRALTDHPPGVKMIQRGRDLLSKNIIDEKFFGEFEIINDVRTNSRKLTSYDNFELEDLLYLTQNLSEQLNRILESQSVSV